jgi:hypothetical protein
LPDRCRDFLDRLNRSRGRLLNRCDVPGDFLGGLACLCGETFNFLGHHGETTPGFAGAGSLDCCVEREEIGLRGDAADEVADFADFVNRCRDRLSTASVIAFASPVAWLAIVAELATRAAMCSIDCAISSAAVATIPTFVVACSDAAAVARATARNAMPVRQKIAINGA